MTEEFWRWTESRWTNPDVRWKDAKIITGGVDVGSVSSQAVVCCDGEVYCYSNIRTGADSPASARNAMNRALEGTGLAVENLRYIVGTGYGRVNVPFANRAITEITCHARGANRIYGPAIRTILDMGGQDCKAIRCDGNGKVTSFLMNDKCAAGTGRGMEVFADLLGIPINEIGEVSLTVKEEPPPVSSTCVVFAKSEASGLLREGWPAERVAAAYCSAMARRIFTLLERIDVEPEFGVTGGIAKNRGVMARLEKKLGLKPLTPRYDTQIAGALGAALLGEALVKKGKKSSRQ